MLPAPLTLLMSQSSKIGRGVLSRALVLTAIISTLSPLGAQTVTNYPVDAGGVIADNVGTLPGGQLTSFTFTVGEVFTVGAVRLRFSASHAWAADLRVLLESPDGTTVELFTELEEEGPSYFADITFRDDALNAINDSSVGTDTGPWSGDYRLQSQLLSSFNGKVASGIWTLRVIDKFSGQSGYLYGANDDSNTVPSNSTRFGTAAGTELILVSDGDVVVPLSIEDWRMAHFGTTMNSGDAANDFDFEPDGIPNIIEYGLGLDPKSGLGENGMQGLSTGGINIADDRLELVIPMPAVPAPDANYEVRAASDLSNWITIAQKRGIGQWVELGGTVSEAPESGGRVVTTIQDLTPMSSHPRRFLYLSIVEVP